MSLEMRWPQIINYLRFGCTPVAVLDGAAPDEKLQTLQKRHALPLTLHPMSASPITLGEVLLDACAVHTLDRALRLVCHAQVLHPLPDLWRRRRQRALRALVRAGCRPLPSHGELHLAWRCSLLLYASTSMLSKLPALGGRLLTCVVVQTNCTRQSCLIACWRKQHADSVHWQIGFLRWQGLWVVQAPGEAEAMCAALTSAGHADACATTDGDALLFGAPVLFHTLKLGVCSLRALLMEQCVYSLPAQNDYKVLYDASTARREEAFPVTTRSGKAW